MLCTSKFNAMHSSCLFVGQKRICIALRRCALSTTLSSRKQNAIMFSHLPTAQTYARQLYHSTNCNNNHTVKSIDKFSSNNINTTSINSFAALQNYVLSDEKVHDLYNSLCEHIVSGNAVAAAEHARMLMELITNEKHAHITQIKNNSVRNEEETNYISTEANLHNNSAEPVISTESIDASNRLSLPMGDTIESKTKDDDIDDDMPIPRHDDVEDAVLAAEREFRRSIDDQANCNEDASVHTAANVKQSTIANLLTSSKQLCITIIETAFEAIDSSDNDENEDNYSNGSDTVSKINEDSTTIISKACSDRKISNKLCDKTQQKVDSNNSKTDTRIDIHTRILNEYLAKEAMKWKAQKNAIAKVILDTAQRLQITPLSLLQAENTFPTFTEGSTNNHLTNNMKEKNDTTSSTSQWRLWKHCNVVVRGELPETAQSILRDSESSYPNHDSGNMELQRVVNSELEVLKRRLSEQGIAFSHEDEHLARVELCLRHCTMRYVIGIHRQLQLALDNDKGLHTFMKQHNLYQSSDNVRSGSEFFIHEVMQALNSVPSSLVASFESMNSKHNLLSSPQELLSQETPQQLDNEQHDLFTKVSCNNCQTTEDEENHQLLLQTLATPVIPYTFMLKCCLWFDIPRSDLEQEERENRKGKRDG